MSDLPIALKLDISAALPDAIKRATAAAKKALQQAGTVASTLVQCTEMPEGFERRVQDLREARDRAGHHLFVHHVERAGRPPLELPEAFRPYALLSAVSQVSAWQDVQGRKAAQVCHAVAGYACAHIDELCSGERTEGVSEATITTKRCSRLEFHPGGGPRASRRRLRPLRWRGALVTLARRLGCEVDRLTKRPRSAGVSVVDGPHRTGDGYYESVVLDPDRNRVEITV
jgi:lactoylglutathione lyase